MRKSTAKRKPSSRSRPKPFIIGIATSEYASVRVYSGTSAEAMETIREMLARGQLSMIEFEHGENREGPYTCDVQDDVGERNDIALTVKNGKVMSAPEFKLICPFCQYDGSRWNLSLFGRRYHLPRDCLLEAGQQSGFIP